MMNKKPLTTARIAYINLTGKPGRAIALIIVVSIMAFAMFGGIILSRSLDNGMISLDARLGADIALIPPGKELYYENMFLTGDPVHFHFESDIIQQISEVEGVAQITPQFHLATFATTPCCDIGVQLIGFDYDTDFVVTAWLSQFLDRQMSDGEAIIGRNVIVERDRPIMFFGHALNVVARLDRSGTGMDNAIFLNMNTARAIAHTAQLYGHIPYNVDTRYASSAILISVAFGYDVLDVASRIQWDFPGVGVVISQGIYYNMSANLRFFTTIINTVTIALAVLSVLLLAVMFAMTANSRKKEFAVLRILGASRTKLTGIVLMEALDVSICGAIAGSLLAAFVVFPFGIHIGVQLGVPLLLPTVWDSLLLLGLTLVLSVGIGSASSAYSAFKISRAEAYATLREGE